MLVWQFPGEPCSSMDSNTYHNFLTHIPAALAHKHAEQTQFLDKHFRWQNQSELERKARSTHEKNQNRFFFIDKMSIPWDVSCNIWNTASLAINLTFFLFALCKKQSLICLDGGHIDDPESRTIPFTFLHSINSLDFVSALWKPFVKLKRCLSRDLVPASCLAHGISQIHKDSVVSIALGVNVSGHCQEKLTQT